MKKEKFITELIIESIIVIIGIAIAAYFENSAKYHFIYYVGVGLIGVGVYTIINNVAKYIKSKRN
jgi:hypothetical protein